MFEPREKKKIKITLVIFFVSFSFLFFYETKFEPEITKIEDLSFFNIENVVKLKGEFKKQSIYLEKELLFGTFKDESEEIAILFFQRNTTFDEDKKYNLIGKVGMYNNKLQIIGIKVDEIIN